MATASFSFDATVGTPFHPDVEMRTSISKILFSFLMLLAGVLLFAFTFKLEDRTSAISMALMVLGVGLFAVGTFRLFWRSKELVYLPTGSVAKGRSLFFDLKYLEQLVAIVNSDTFSVCSHFKTEPSGNVRLDVLISEDRKFAAVQLFQFVPYSYQPVTSVRYFTNEAASAVAAFLSEVE